LFALSICHLSQGRCGGCSDKGKYVASALSSIAAGSKCLASTGGFVVVQEFVMLMPNIWRSCFR